MCMFPVFSRLCVSPVTCELRKEKKNCVCVCVQTHTIKPVTKESRTYHEESCARAILLKIYFPTFGRVVCYIGVGGWFKTGVQRNYVFFWFCFVWFTLFFSLERKEKKLTSDKKGKKTIFGLCRSFQSVSQ